MRRTWIIFLIGVGAVIALISVLPSPRRAESGKLRVAVSIPPQAYLAGRIGGGLVSVETVVPPGKDAHTYTVTPAQREAIARCRAYFTIGLPFEKNQIAAKLAATDKSLLFIDTTRGVPLRHMTAEEAGADADPDEPPHAAGEPDPHTWLNPRFARIEAANICAGLKQLDPAHAAEYDANLKRLDADLDRVDAKIAAALAPLKGRSFFVYHPAFGYFADAYGLTQVPVEIEGKEPGPRQVAELIKSARRDGVRVIFVQPQFSARTADTIAAQIGGAVVRIDDLAYDYIQNLETIADKIKEALAR